MSREEHSVIEDLAFGELSNEIEHFANHTRKLVRASHRYRPILKEASTWSEGVAPLDSPPASPAAAMRAIDKFARSRRENRQALFGSYFAHHHLRNQAIHAQYLLDENLSSDPKRRPRICHRFYDQANEQRRKWVSSLLEMTIAASAPDLNRNDYCAFNVGALTDHEDVDLAIVVSSIEARAALTRGFSQISKTFVRFASKIQLFVSEQLATPRTGALLEEYQQLLEEPARNVVSVTQLLGSQYLCGAQHLSRALDERVIHQYYAGQGEPTVHEGFLRSVMAELKHFLVPDHVPGVLSPKREIYVPSKLATAAVRVIHGVHEPIPPRALQLVAARDPENRDIYLELADAFVQNEILRSLMFLYVFPSDEFDLADPSIRETSERVAMLLGLGTSARRSSEDRLLGAYADFRTRALRCVSTLSNKIDAHLTRVSTFRRIVERGEKLHKSPKNIPIRLLRALENYKGSVFWDEVIELISGRPETTDRFVADFIGLEAEQRKSIATKYVAMMSEDAASLVEFLVLIAAQDRENKRSEREIAEAGPIFWAQMIVHLRSHPNTLDSFTHRLDTETESEAMFRLANAFNGRELAQLADLIEGTDSSTQSARVVRAIRSVIILVHHRSNAIGRITTRVLGRTPEFLHRLSDTRRLRDLTNELRTQAAQERRPREQTELLGDAFDVVVMGATLRAILEFQPAARDADFTEAVDLYIRDLFKACFRDVRRASPIFSQYRPGSGIALFATGGYGRGEAFGGDWDYIAVVDHDDRGLKKFFGKVLQRVSAAMTRRGLLPHNRLADQFNAYTVSIPELLTYFGNRTENTFIDEAEALEARFFLGDPVIARRYQDQVVGTVLHANRRAFITDLLNEIDARRSFLPRGLNLKLSPGGLREIHLLWLAVRVIADLPRPMVPELLPNAAAVLPDVGDDIKFLIEANQELRRARDVYRLVVAFDDTMEVDVLLGIAQDLAPMRASGVAGDFQRQLEELLEDSKKRIDLVAEGIRARLDSE